ncbi:putative GTP-binding protein 6 [Hyalella azteca]|uniref:GTP-binding protein 6 n=1 Tax=Hyalella azteca TaxID=294128 RepID=A0A8B7P2Q6_HYAAZ|nr:putative GTP-binding protein 6 [Hyalella azteca]
MLLDFQIVHYCTIMVMSKCILSWRMIRFVIKPKSCTIISPFVSALPQCLAGHHYISSSCGTYREMKKNFGYRVSPDHRSNITPGNRPESELSNADNDSLVLDDAQYAALLHDAESFGAGVVSKASIKGGVMVVLPWVKWGPRQTLVTCPERVLDEAAALIGSLDNVTLINKSVVKVRYISKSIVFGPGQLEQLKACVADLPVLAALFVAVDRLSRTQIRTLERELGVRVVDRYWVVLSIFHQHAKTVEARMQVALAELPYLRSMTKLSTEQSLIDQRIRLLQMSLNKLLRHRMLVRNRRKVSDLPSVAVVGYTNAGKTSLISALCADGSIQGRDQLFATLDVTAHGLSLPCGVRCVLLDTVGFIQDLPTELVASFNATLQDAAQADVIIHVRDLSHPDRLLHHTTVMAALYSIDLPHTTPIITLDNKADLAPDLRVSEAEQPCTSFLLDDKQYEKSCRLKGHKDAESHTANLYLLHQLQDHYSSTPALAVSATTKQGLVPVITALEEQLLRVTQRKLFRMKLPTGGPHLRALRSVAGTPRETPCPDDANLCEVVAALTEKQFAQFKKLCSSINSNS